MKLTLGIIGGGQLGMMLTEAAKKFPQQISRVIVLDPTKNCPASQVGAEQIIGDFKDEEAIKNLASKSDIMTYEIESGDSTVLKSIENNTKINPSPETLRIIQDKFLQKNFLAENNLPVTEFVSIKSLDDLKNKIKNFGFPVLLKARRDGYDGRGNFQINSEDDIKKAFQYFKGQALMLEKFVDFKMEVSVIASRNTKGEIATYPLVENIHEENILKMTLAPARVSQNVNDSADSIAKRTVDLLKGAGVFGIEMFVTKDNRIVINEIAPRVHNSGHHTLYSGKTSQFEQHIRAILGSALGDTKLHHYSIMYNILGPKGFVGNYKSPEIENNDGVFLKMYLKKESKPMRKLGHVTVVDIHDEKDFDKLLESIEKLKKSLEIRPLQ